MSTEQMLFSGLAGLAGAIGLLYRRLESGMKTCEDDRRALWQALVKMQACDCTRAPKSRAQSQN